MPTTSVRLRISLLSRSMGVVGPDLAPDLAGERGEAQDVVAGVVQVRGLGELGLERGDDLVVLGAQRGGVGLLEDGAHQGGHPGWLVLLTLVSRSRR